MLIIPKNNLNSLSVLVAHILFRIINRWPQKWPLRVHGQDGVYPK